MQQHYLVMDVGNTNIEVGIYNPDGIVCSWRLCSNHNQTEDEYYAVLNSLALGRGIDLSKIELCAIASVVPELSRVFRHLFDKYFSAQVLNVTAKTPLGLKFSMDNPDFIGADLVVNAYSAWHKYQTNSIICDFGTATTIQLVSSEGAFIGTVIAPGIVISSANLFQEASLLTKIQLESPAQQILGTNTKDSLLSGIVQGHCLMTDAFIRRIKQENSYLGEFKVIATGGIANLLGKTLTEIDLVDKTLTIDGLYRICRKHDC